MCIRDSLGAEEFAKRERAYQALHKMGQAVSPQLREASLDPCPERARRAALLLDKIQRAKLAGQLAEIEADGWYPWMESATYEDGLWHALPEGWGEYMPSGAYYRPWQESREATRRLVVDMLRADVPVVLVRRMLMTMRAAEEEAWKNCNWGDDARPPGWAPKEVK